MGDFGAGVISGVIFAVIITLTVAGPVIAGLDDSVWHIDAVAHGYAHFDRDSSWHWNNESAKP